MSKIYATKAVRHELQSHLTQCTQFIDKFNLSLSTAFDNGELTNEAAELVKMGRSFLKIANTPHQENEASIAAIQFALEDSDGIEFLRCWQEGDFDAIRTEWPEAPESVFNGADPLFITDSSRCILMKPEPDTLKSTLKKPNSTFFVLNQNCHHFEVNVPLNIQQMKSCRFFETHEELLEEYCAASGSALDEIGESIQISLYTDDTFTETALNTIEYPLTLDEGQTIEDYISNWYL